jgi:uncharacterized protein
MIYVFHLLDKPHGLELRQRMRPEHKAMVGSVLAIDFDSREAALQWQAGEPFTKAGLYASVAVHAFQNLWPQKAGFPPAA